MADNKNPTAIRIGQRIKQARKMAGFNTASQLLNKIDNWGTGRLGNYEAGISMPSPDDIETIALITDSSACWIMFGAGPIRASGRDHQAIRHQNLTTIVEKYKSKRGGLKKLLSTTNLSQKKIDTYIDDPFLTIPDRFLKKLESLEGKPDGWMNEQHVESDPVCSAFPEDMQEIMTIFSNLEKHPRHTLLEIARVINNSST
ncbi:hypothetical protein MNBD_GAMMA12-2277 [hydrothermal vent metagenome]|uniref:Uncharacterized protein n=1 Tax=hydrothermal vent metagenome TaxID=652676 RepID=A0A3B0YNE4_9ZZZZ